MSETAPVPHILVVDDDTEVRYSLNRVLSSRHYRVQEAASGEEGVAAVKKQPPDVVLLDAQAREALRLSRVVVALSPNDPHLPGWRALEGKPVLTCMGGGEAECSNARVWDSHTVNEYIIKVGFPLN